MAYSSSRAIVAIAVAVIAGSVTSPTRAAWVGQRLVVGLCAGVVAALGIDDLVHVLLIFPRWVPDIAGRVVPASISAADRLDSNRSEAEDPYVAVLFRGALIAAALACASQPAAVRQAQAIESTAARNP